jgi:NhaP-type Na+/H+ or K+/H+ antiporter
VIAFATILVMLAAAVVLLTLARSLRLPYPALLALAGAGVAVAPVDIGLRLDPELTLALFIAPVLLDAAYDTSLRDLKRHWAPVASLALIAVGLTTAAVALVVHAMVPSIPWAAAVAIGAIVAPPDAVAATTLLRELKLPRRVSVILEGEALLNDASALIIYRLAVTAVLAGGSIGADAIAPTFLLSLFGSVIAGLSLAWVSGHVTRRIEDVPSSIIVQFVSTYGVWVLADRAGLSPILTMVSYAMTLARSAPAYLPARLRIPSYAVWETAVLVLNVLAFLIIGLELGPIIAAARPGDLGRWTWLGAAVLSTVIGVRLLWTLAGALWAQWRFSRGAPAPGDGPLPNWQTGLVIGWAGTRGLVTVATALALPQGFPERGMLLFAAFTVTLGTLLIQG